MLARERKHSDEQGHRPFSGGLSHQTIVQKSVVFLHVTEMRVDLLPSLYRAIRCSSIAQLTGGSRRLRGREKQTSSDHTRERFGKEV